MTLHKPLPQQLSNVVFSQALQQFWWNAFLAYYIRFNGLSSTTTCVSWHQKGKPFWVLLEQEMMGWQ